MKYNVITYIGKTPGFSVKLGKEVYEFEWQKGVRKRPSSVRAGRPYLEHAQQGTGVQSQPAEPPSEERARLPATGSVATPAKSSTPKSSKSELEPARTATKKRASKKKSAK